MPIRLTPLKWPQLSLDTFRALCAATTEFGSLAPWEYMCDMLLSFSAVATGGNLPKRKRAEPLSVQEAKTTANIFDFFRC
jgi:hypothetical protein